MDVDLDTWVAGAIRARDLDRRRGRIPATGDLNLVAADVELGAAGLACGMERQCLRAEEVISRLDIRGDLDVHLAAAFVQIARPPVVVVADGAAGFLGPRVGEDLEPACCAVGLAGVGDFGQVHLHGAPVGAADGLVVAGAVARLLVHLYCDCSARGDAACSLGGFGACVADEVPAAYVCDGGVGAWHANAG